MNDLELSILWWIQNNIYCDVLTPVMKFFSLFGNLGSGWIILCFILLCFKQTRKTAIIVLIIMLVTLLVNNYCFKLMIDRPRPYDIAGIEPLLPDPGDSSFPSGHAANAFTAAVAFFLLDKRIGIPALIAAGLIAFSRLYFFLHYPSDVLAGAIIGSVVAVAMVIISKRVLSNREKAKNKTPESKGT